MVDATASRARLRGLGVLGRSRPARGGGAAPTRPSAARRRTGTDGAAIAAGTPPRPNSTSPRPGTDDPAASTGWLAGEPVDERRRRRDADHDGEQQYAEVEPEMRRRADQQTAQRVDLVRERVDLAEH